MLKVWPRSSFKCSTKASRDYQKRRQAENAAKSQTFIGKKIVAGGRVGIGIRIDDQTGDLVVRGLRSVFQCHPDNVRLVALASSAE